jgi:copper resistance protein B
VVAVSSVGRYTDVQAGLRYDLEPEGRAYATVSVESLLPYWFEVEAAAFLSDRGDAFGRLEASHDLRFTQRLILQPRVELELAAQDVPESSIGSGFSSAELGLRLRYDVRREFAPYVGVNFEWLLGQTAEFARAAGADDEEASFVMGLRAWF